MLAIEIPGYGSLELEHLVLDLNGTLAQDGEVLAGVAEAVSALSAELQVIVVTADQHGNADELVTPLGLEHAHVIDRGSEAEAKLDLVDELGGDSVVAIGNGANDALMLRDAALGIAVIGGEGAARGAVEAADVLVYRVEDALGLLLEPRRLIATLRR
jgi:P-type E1-E2 ATPase